MEYKVVKVHSGSLLVVVFFSFLLCFVLFFLNNNNAINSQGDLKPRFTGRDFYQAKKYSWKKTHCLLKGLCVCKLAIPYMCMYT